MKYEEAHGGPPIEPVRLIELGPEFESLIRRVTDIARCLGDTKESSGMGGWLNEIEIPRFIEAALLDRVCLEFTVRGFVPKLEVHHDHDDETYICTYQGRGTWRVHQPIREAGGEISRYDTGTQHFLDLMSGGLLEALELLRVYAGRVANRRVDCLRGDLRAMEERLGKL